MQKIVFSLFFSISFFISISGCTHKGKTITYEKSFPSTVQSTKYTSKAIHKATMKSYKVHGKQYYPCNVNTTKIMNGVASWYGSDFHGKYTSNGEVYNMYARTAAHKTWPMDTIVRIKNLENGKSTIVRINDRGPFIKGRIIDCSYLAGKEIGLDKMGIAQVEIQVIGCAGNISSKRSTLKYVSEDKQKRVLITNYGIQLGAFSSYGGAKKLQYTYSQQYKQYSPMLEKYTDNKGSTLYRVILFGFPSEADVKIFKKNNNLTGSLYSKKIG